ncbi:MAG: hypothetical protein M0Q41_10730 [Bacteroidales bacterium]|nr:hypothetical protein [Bacteroidales bacterium]
MINPGFVNGVVPQPFGSSAGQTPFSKAAFNNNGWQGVWAYTSGLQKTNKGTITIFGESYELWSLSGLSDEELRYGAIYAYASGHVSSGANEYSIYAPNGASIPLIYTDPNKWQLRGYIWVEYKNYYYYYAYYTERDQLYRVFSEVTKSEPTKTTFKPYEPLDLDGIQVRARTDFTTYSSKEFVYNGDMANVPYTGWEKIREVATQILVYPTIGYFNYTHAGSYQTISVKFSNTTVSWELYISPWDNKVYWLNQRLNDFKIYSGITVANDFLSAFDIKYTVSNEYKTLTFTEDRGLELSRMSKTIISESDSSLTFNYEVDSSNIIIGHVVTDNIIKLASGNAKFANVTYKKTYNLGDTIANFNPIYNGFLTYSDGTTIGLDDISYTSNPSVTTSLGNLPLTILVSHGATFTMTYTLPTQHFGALYPTFNCDVAEAQDISSMVLVNAKTHFLFGEVVDFGSTALGTKIECFNIYGVKISEILYADFSGYITSKDSRYGKLIGGASVSLTTSELTLNSTFGVHNIAHKIKMSYAANLVVNSAAISKFVYIDDSFNGFSDLNLATASVTYYNNSGASLVTETKNVTSVLNLSHNTPNFTLNTQVITIAASAVYEGRTLTLTNAFQITCELIRPTQIVVSGTGATTVYYDNDKDVFKYPTDLTFLLIFNDHTEEDNHTEVVDPMVDLIFYRNSGLTTLINPESFIRSFDGNRIYFKHKDYDLSSSYTISFIEDEIDTVSLNAPISFTLGNRFNTLRSLFDIKVTYISGIEVTNFEAFVFKQTTVILADTIPVIIINGNEYALDINDITFVKPSIDKIEVDTSTLNTSYSNDTDTIDVASNVVVITKYQGAEFVEQCSYDQSGLTGKGKYTIENSDVASGFAFDGSDVVVVDMEGEVEKSLELEIKVLNYFDNLDLTNNSTSIFVSVFEITDITGISIAKLMNSYSVGDTFLDPELDDSEVYIYYNKKEIVNDIETTVQKKKKIRLASGFSAINIFPIKGTKFIRTNEALTVRITAATNERASLEYTINVGFRKVIATDINKHILRVVFASEYTPSEISEEKLINKYLIVDDENTSVINGERKLREDVSLTDIKVYGYIDNVNDTSSNGRVVFFEDYVPPVSGYSNIKITFPCYVEGQADHINKCTFGQLFGNNNSKNRLFLSGNPNLPNCDWHSGAINTTKIEGDFSDENGDFSYFDDLSYCFYGQTDNKIVGYDIVTNDKMVVLKSKSDKEPTIYYRTSGLIQALDASGNALTDFSGRSLYEESYPLVVGNIGVGALSNKAIINFNGDTLFLSSDRQLDGLDIEGILGDTQRYANSRSYFINPLLKTLNLKEAWLYTNHKYLYLITKDFIMVSHFEAFNEETRQYEWWKVNVPNVEVFVDLDEELYFGTSEGKFVKLETEGFQDISKIFLAEGAAVPLVSGQEFDDQIQVSDTIINQLVDGSDYFFKIVSKESDYNSYMYNQIATINNTKTGTFDIYIDKTLNAFEVCGYVDSQMDNEIYHALIQQLSTERIYYLNRREEENEIVDTNPNSPLKVYGKAYRLELLDEFHMGKGLLFKLVDAESGEELSLQTLSRAALVERMEETYTIVDIHYGLARFKLRDNRNQVLNIVRYAAQSMTKNFKAEIFKYRNVKAYYITSPHTMGDLMHNKTIWGWTLTNDTQIKSSIEICQATNDTHLEEMATIVDFNRRDYGLNLENFNVANINFDKYVIPHKYTFYRPLNVPFISFGFRNNDADNAVLSSMQIIYTIPFASVGNN